MAYFYHFTYGFTKYEEKSYSSSEGGNLEKAFDYLTYLTNGYFNIKSKDSKFIIVLLKQNRRIFCHNSPIKLSY